ncbi:MAG TPA: hypothetical protein VLM40_22925 [Gemmata sp.]|nr:hypothetical protein [Gemmata sp.]
MAAAVSALSACGPEPSAVRELDRRGVNVATREAFADAVSVIRSADELAKSKLFKDDASHDALKKQVHFEKEKLVVVVYWGSSSASVHVAISKDRNSVSFNLLTPRPALTDLRPHVHVYAVPRGMAVETPIEKLKKMLDRDAMRVVKLGLAVTFVREKDPPRPEPVVIASADELAKSKLFADDESRVTLKNQTDFASQKLVVFVWRGSGSDKLASSLSKDGKTSTFTYTRGLTDDLREHAAAYAVPRDCEVKVVKK